MGAGDGRSGRSVLRVEVRPDRGMRVCEHDAFSSELAQNVGRKNSQGRHTARWCISLARDLGSRYSRILASGSLS